MKTEELIKLLDTRKEPSTVSNCDNFEVRGVSCNSKNVSDNFIFIAIKGLRQDGNRFIQEAIDKGAKTIIVQKLPIRKLKSSPNVNFILVKDSRKALATLAAHFYGNPASRIKVVGITGTNGKTTISYLIEALLKEAGYVPSVIGTINYRFKDRVITADNTTPGPVQLQSLLADMQREAVQYAIIEVSSHALDQQRAEGINFHSAIFTNLTQDHLDYHKTLENYFTSKAKLFKEINKSSFTVINNDDSFGRRLKRLTKARIITYGIRNKADVMARDIRFDCCHTEFVLLASGDEIKFNSRLIGRHNVYNVLAAVAWTKQEGISLTLARAVIEKFNFVPGRLERIDSNGDFSVFVDYAHTEDALKNVLRTLREIAQKRIIVVFGCGGDRDKTKRPKMGEVASELADYVIISNDNPRSEEPEEIIKDIKKGIKKFNFCVIPDRMDAIRKSLSLAEAGDIVLVAGKGHENYQVIKDKRIHFDDREAIRECLKSMNY